MKQKITYSKICVWEIIGLNTPGDNKVQNHIFIYKDHDQLVSIYHGSKVMTMV